MRTARVEVLMVFAVLFMIAGSALVYADVGLPSDKSAAIVNIELNNVPLKQAIDTLFQGRGLSYVVQPGVTGKVVELKLKGLTFNEALKALADAGNFTYCIEDGVYVIGPKATVAVARRPAQPTVKYAPAAPASPVQEPVESQPVVLAPPPPAQVVVNQNQAPVFYGQPGSSPYYDSGYGGNPGFYTVGSAVRVYNGGGFNPVVVTGGYPSIIGTGFFPPPPPPGWVSPYMLSVMRFGYATQSRPFFITPWTY